ncbi:MAG: DUF885 domain-containing protein [Cytophagales bacterium]|nr:DUF885 domain-containing protein [Cytophagales bacterium]
MKRFKLFTFLIFLVFILGCNETHNEEKRFNNFVEEFNSNSENISINIDRSSETYLHKKLEETKYELKSLRKINIDKLERDEKIDYKFIESILVGKEIDLEEIQSWKKDPRDYMNFRQISNNYNSSMTCEDKYDYLLEYLPVVLNDLQFAMVQIDSYVPRFQELGLYMAENSMSIFSNDISELTYSCQENTDWVEDPRADKIDSLNKEIILQLELFIDFLKNELPNKEKSSFFIGKETYNKMLKNQFLLDYNDETLWEFGWKEFNNTLDKMDALAKEINPDKTTQDILVDIKNEYPHPDSMIQAHQYWVDKSGEHIKSNNLIPIPWKERVNVVPREEYLRKTSYYGNFSRSRGVDDEGYFTSEWKINPFEHRWDQKTKDEYLVEHDWGVIIVTAPHETYAGHHIQGLYQMHNPKELRRNNGLSLFSEGWGLYNEQLMLETGFYPNKKIKLRQLQLRLWRNARVIYDVGMHTGKLSYEDAISLMTDKVGFLRWAAQLEIDSSSSRPGYFIGYFMGMIEILKMRHDYEKMSGENYSISDFHENLLKIGNMPPSLMREALLN